MTDTSETWKDEYVTPASVRRIHGTVAEVTCPCGEVTPLCLGKKVGALSCFSCGSLVRVPDWSNGADPSRRIESGAFWRDVLMAEVDGALVDSCMAVGDMTVGDVMKMREAITRGTDALLYELFKIKYEGLNPRDKS